MAGIGKKVQMLNFGFVTRKRHILAQNGVNWRLLRPNPWWSLGCRWEE